MFLNYHVLYLNLNKCWHFWNQILLPVEVRSFPSFFLEPNIVSEYSILPCDDGDDEADDNNNNLYVTHLFV